MRVLTVTNMYPSERRSHFGAFVRDRVESLRQLGLEVDVWFSDPTDDRLNYFKRLPSLQAALRNGRFDIVHCEHTYSVLQLAAVRPLRRLRPPVVFTIHEGESFREAADPEADLLKRLVYMNSLKLRALRAADRVVAVERRLPPRIGYDGAFDVIQPGIDLDRFRPIDQAEARRQLGLPLDARIVFFPADPTRHEKGGELFAQARAALRTAVHWVTGGTIPFQQMPLYVNAADVVVQTSRLEASPMVAKEALACNRPLVSTDVGDVRELFGATRGCFITTFDPADVAAKLDEALELDVSGLDSRARVTELGLGLSDVARKYLAVYEELLGSTNGR